MKESWEWAEDDILSLIHNKIRESTTLEYKSCDALGHAEGKKNEISKDVSAFANSAGGTIVYGVIENSSHEPESIDAGFDPSVLSGEWLEQVINSRIERRISGVIINTVDLLNTRPGKVLYVVYIPESNLAPHMAADDRFYKRFNFQRVAMKEYEVRNLVRQEHYPSREIVRAWRDAVINPLLHTLESELRYFETGQLTWDRYGKRIKEVSRISRHSSYTGLEEEVYSTYPDIQKALDKHDELVTGVNASTEALAEAVSQSSHLRSVYDETTSHESLQTLQKNFRLELDRYTTDEDILNEMLGGRSATIDERFAILAAYIVNEFGKLPSDYIIHPLWNTYSDKFIGILNLPPVNDHYINSKQSRDELRRHVETLIAQVKMVRAELSRQHGIPVEEPVVNNWRV